MIRYGLSIFGGVLLAHAAWAAQPTENAIAKAYVKQGHEELVLARTAELNKAYPQRVAHINRAISDFQAALRAMPDDYYAYNQLGLAEFMNGRLYHAIQYYNTAITLYPQAARSYMERGNVWYQIGDTDKASKDWQMAVQYDASMGSYLSANLAEQQRLYREVHPQPGA
jgi:tetratricopeptide (TPR) repeat protein